MAWNPVASQPFFLQILSFAVSLHLHIAPKMQPYLIFPGQLLTGNKKPDWKKFAETNSSLQPGCVFVCLDYRQRGGCNGPHYSTRRWGRARRGSFYKDTTGGVGGARQKEWFLAKNIHRQGPTTNVVLHFKYPLHF